MRRAGKAGGWLDSFRADVAGAVNRVRRHPIAFLATALTLTAGLGAALGTYNAAYWVRHRPLPYRDPGGIVIAEDPVGGTLVSPYDWHPHPQAAAVFTSLAEYHLETDFLDLPGSERPLLMALVTPEFFRVLGVNLSFQGMAAAPPADRPLAWLPVIISHSLWRDGLGSDRQIVGKKIALRRMYPYQFLVVGVAPAGMAFPPGVDVWMPEHLTSSPLVQAAVPPSELTTTIAHLRPGVSIGEAENAIRGWSHKDQNWIWTGSSRLRSLREFLGGSYFGLGPSLWDLALVFLALSITTAASIGWLDINRRGEELRLRLTLGGSALRVWRALSIETAGVLLMAAPLALLLRWALDREISATFSLPISLDARLAGADLAIILAVLGASAAVVTISNWRVLAGHVQGTSGQRKSSKRSGLIPGMAMAFPVSVSALVLALAGVLVHSALVTSTIDPGVRAQGVYVVNIGLPDGEQRFEFRPGEHKLASQVVLRRQKEYAQAVSFDFHEICKRLVGSGQVQSAGVISLAPYSGLPVVINSVYISRGADREHANEAQVHALSMSAAAAGALGLRLTAGRGFSDAAGDDQGTVIINQALAREIGPGYESLGWYVWTSTLQPARIVGIVADVHEPDLLDPSVPTVYFPFHDFASPDADLVVRAPTGAVSGGLLPSVRAAVRAVVPGASVSRFRSLRDMVSTAGAPARFAMASLLALAIVGVLMAAGCAWALCASEVKKRRAEIGVRLALGAKPSRLVRAVLGRQAMWTAPAAVTGCLCAWWVSQGIGSILPGTLPDAPFFIAGAAIILEGAVLVVHGVAMRNSLRKNPCELITAADQ